MAYMGMAIVSFVVLWVVETTSLRRILALGPAFRGVALMKLTLFTLFALYCLRQDSHRVTLMRAIAGIVSMSLGVTVLIVLTLSSRIRQPSLPRRWWVRWSAVYPYAPTLIFLGVYWITPSAALLITTGSVLLLYLNRATAVPFR